MEPFAVTAADIARLDQYQFRRFMRDLLRNEVLACATARFLDNPGDGSDDGQDAETTREEPSSTADPGAPSPDNAPGDKFIPIRLCVWQYKAEQRAPSASKLKEEIQKAKPKAALDSGGNYRFVAQQPHTNESEVNARLKAIAVELGYRPEQVEFHAQASLAERARLYPSLVTLPFFNRRLEQVQNFEQWTERYATPQFDVQSRQAELAQLTDYLKNATPPGHVRIIGHAGVGKTRLVQYALESLHLGATAVYAPSATSAPFQAFFQWCTGNVTRMVLVIDECDEATAMRLREEVIARQRPILLITINKIEYEDMQTGDRDLRISLNPMTEDDIVRILGRQHADRSRLYAIARVVGGFVKLALVVAQAISRRKEQIFDLATLVTLDTIRDAVLQHLRDPAAMRFLGAISLFSEVRTDTSTIGSDLAILTEFAGVSIQQAREWIQRAITAQVLSDRGTRVFVTPALLAVLLARTFVLGHLQDLPPWLRSLPPRLQESFAEQLGQLRYSLEGQRLAREIVDASGPFGDLLFGHQPWARKAFLALGSIAKTDALARLEAWLGQTPAAAADFEHDRFLRRLLFRLLWRNEHFARAFTLVLRGLHESSAPTQSSLEPLLRGSLRILLANSGLPFSDRFEIAKRAIADNAHRLEVRMLIVRCLAAGTGRGPGDGYSHDDVDISGREYWQPTYDEWTRCTRLVVDFLSTLLRSGEQTLRNEAAANLIERAAEFIRGGAHEPLLGVVSQLIAVDPRVGKLREELERSLAFGSLSEDATSAVHAAIAALPQDLATRIRVLAESWPLVKDRAKRGLPNRPDAVAIVSEIMALSERASALALLFEPWARNSHEILIALAQHEHAHLAWPDMLVAARKSKETWGASLFLTVAHDTVAHDTLKLLKRTPVELLDSDCEFDRSVGAETITRMNASDEEVCALIDAIRRGRIGTSSLRYAALGQWIEQRSANVVADLIRTISATNDGQLLGLALSHAAGANLSITTEESIQLVASTMFLAQGNDRWTWQEVATRLAAQEPEALGRALIGDIAKRPRTNTYVSWAESEVGDVIDLCINAVPSLACLILELWDSDPDFVESIGRNAILPHIRPNVLADWATDESHQRALGIIAVAAPDPTTEALLQHFGSTSAFATKLRDQLRPTMWTGSLAQLMIDTARNVRRWASDSARVFEFREWATASADWLERGAEHARRYEVERLRS